MTSVYWIAHKDHTDIFSQGYVGVSNNVEYRWNTHKSLKTNVHLKNAINKYGWDNLVKKVVLIGEEDYCLEIESKLRSEDRIGWNLTKGGGKPPSSLGKKFGAKTPETKAKISLAKKGVTVAWNKGKAWNEEIKSKVSAGVKKLWQDPEYSKMMSMVRKGKPSVMLGKKHSPETIERMRLVKIGKPSGKKGMKMSQEHKDKMKELAKAQAWTCQHCNTSGYGKGAGNRWHMDNCKFKEITT